MSKDQGHLDSMVVHAGQEPDPASGAVMQPIVLASTFVKPSLDADAPFVYGRSHNPTRCALERCVARLEGSTLDDAADPSWGGFAFASGMAAIGGMLDLLDSGDHVIAMDDLYGGTHRLFSQIKERSTGLRFTYVDMTDPLAIESAIEDRTRLIWVESPTNPLLKVVDLAAVAGIAGERGILSACDNTFASPLLQRPLSDGFDLVMHSGTKYLSGHSDVVSGLLVTGDAALAERIRFIQKSGGGVQGPFDAYLVLRGIKTLSLRMRRHCESALKVAQFLEAHDAIEHVAYPGLESHPQHEIAMRQMRIDGEGVGGGMVTCVLRGGLDASRHFLDRVTLFTLAESLGGVESLIEHPAIMTHASVPPAQRAALGIDDGLVRVSVGIEDCDDLLADLEQALA